jgi:glutamyl-tRNA synthetase
MRRGMTVESLKEFMLE